MRAPSPPVRAAEISFPIFRAAVPGRLKTAIPGSPRWGDGSRARAYLAKRDTNRAIADYTQANRVDPKYAIAYVSRGDEYLAKCDTHGAIADFSTAIELDPKNEQAYIGRGRAYSKAPAATNGVPNPLLPRAVLPVPPCS